MPGELIPMSEPDLADADIEAVIGVLRSRRWSLGPCLEAFEAAFAAYVGTRFAVGVSSGTAGLHCAMAAGGVGPGDEVITSSFSFVASANCVLFEGATPVFADIDEETMNLDPASVAAVITPRTRAVLPVHVFGQPSDMDGIHAAIRGRDLLVVEDACEAVGAEYKGRRAGSLGDMAAFGFYPNKQIAAGEGGIVTTDDPALAEALTSLRNQGRDAMGTWLRHVRLGFNYRLPEMNAALAHSQLKRVDDLLARRARVADWYGERLRRFDGVRALAPAPHTTRFSWFVYVVRLDAGVDRDAVIERLERQGIPSRPYFAPIHLQPYYRDRFGFAQGMLPVTERVAGTTLALPFHANMPEADVARVAEALRAALGNARR